MKTVLTQLLIFRFSYLIYKGFQICINNSNQPLQTTNPGAHPDCERCGFNPHLMLHLSLHLGLFVRKYYLFNTMIQSENILSNNDGVSSSRCTEQMSRSLWTDA